MNTITEAPVLEIRRIFEAPPARVFDAWLTREKWQAWIGPEGCQCEITDFDPRVGGRYRVLMNLTDGRQMPVVGIFRTIDRPRGFAMTWKWELSDQDSLVTISLRDLGGRTELTLRHEGLLTQENCDGHGRGWNSALSKLGPYLADETV